MNVHILQTLAEGPKELMDLRRAVGSPPQSTMRVYSRTLAELGILEQQRQSEFAGSSLYTITSSGTALLKVGEVLQEWLNASPDGAIVLGSTPAKSTVGALVEGWSTNIVRALAAKPLSLTQLNRLIPKVSYPSLERRLGGLRLANLVEPHPGEGRGTPYRTTEWLRRAVVPIASAVGWERKHLADSTPAVGRLDVEAAFLLAVPLMMLPDSLNGKCRLAVEVQGGKSPAFAGVLVCVEEGRIVSCSSRLEGEVEGWATGTPMEWLRRMNGGANEGLDIGGDVGLVLTLTDALRAAGTTNV
ncbi:MAG TPA: winged helix-turn-helix transcriptional regulator [Solirubrobacterales bacterium]|nr:winged helix-turn-helix transcriptional regulator [Solirubrobacterales bacterium]